MSTAERGRTQGRERARWADNQSENAARAAFPLSAAELESAHPDRGAVVAGDGPSEATRHRSPPPPPRLAFHVDVTLTEKDGRWLAVAMLADEPDIGVGDDPPEALRAALEALGEPWATEMAASAELPV